MSIKSEAFSVCKKLRESVHYKKVRQLVFALNFSAYGQAARNFGSQFLGMLLVNQEIDKFPVKLEPLENDEISYLESIHQELVLLNRDCVRPLINAVPEVVLAVDPYSHYNYEKKHLRSDFDFLDSASRGALVSAFHSHPAINRFLKLHAGLGEPINREHYLSDVASYRKQILELGPLRKPTWMNDFARIPSNSPHFNHNSVMFALLAIQDSLYNLDQLIFQSFFEDRFTVIDKNCLIDLGPNVGNGTGRGIGGLFQTVQWNVGQNLLFGSVVILVLMRDAHGTSGNSLVRVEASKKTLGPSQQPCFAEFRFIDEHLNSFPNIVNH